MLFILLLITQTNKMRIHLYWKNIFTEHNLRWCLLLIYAIFLLLFIKKWSLYMHNYGSLNQQEIVVIENQKSEFHKV